mgnify:CR=1 FL=1
MEIKINKESLLEGIGRTQSIVERRATMPILANILLEAEEGSLTIKATDLEVGLAGSYPAQVIRKGGITVPARKFYEIIRELSAEEVHLKSKENNWVEIRSGAAQFQVVGLDAAEFPALPSFEGASFVPLPATPLKVMLDTTAFAASTDETRYHLNGVYWQIKDKNLLRLVATDGHRLALTDWKSEEAGKLTPLGRGVILPRKGISELRRMLEEAGEGSIDAAFHKNHALFRTAGGFLMVRLIEGEFPDYEQVIPRGFNYKATFSREVMLFALRRVSLLSVEKGRGVKFSFSAPPKAELEVWARNPELGEARESLPVEFEGKGGFSIAFNARYIMDVLQVLRADKVSLEMADELSPGLIRPLSDEKHMSLIMPMRM